MYLRMYSAVVNYYNKMLVRLCYGKKLMTYVCVEHNSKRHRKQTRHNYIHIQFDINFPPYLLQTLIMMHAP